MTAGGCWSVLTNRVTGTPVSSVTARINWTTNEGFDAPTLQEIAKKTDGQYFEATSSDELARVYSTMSTKFVGEKKQTEIAFIFAGIGALIAMVAAFLSLWWFGRVA